MSEQTVIKGHAEVLFEADNGSVVKATFNPSTGQVFLTPEPEPVYGKPRVADGV